MSDASVKCPHCDHVNRVIWDFDWGSREIIDTECGECCKPIAIRRHVSVTYYASVPRPPPPPICPGEKCLMCTGEACELCGAGLITSATRPRCEHGSLERHARTVRGTVPCVETPTP